MPPRCFENSPLLERIKSVQPIKFDWGTVRELPIDMNREVMQRILEKHSAAAAYDDLLNQVLNFLAPIEYSLAYAEVTGKHPKVMRDVPDVNLISETMDGYTRIYVNVGENDVVVSYDGDEKAVLAPSNFDVIPVANKQVISFEPAEAGEKSELIIISIPAFNIDWEVYPNPE